MKKLTYSDIQNQINDIWNKLHYTHEITIKEFDIKYKKIVDVYLISNELPTLKHISL